LKFIARDSRVFGKRIPVAVNNFGCHGRRLSYRGRSPAMMCRAGYFGKIITRMVTSSVSLLRSFSTPRELAILIGIIHYAMVRATHRAFLVLAISTISCLLSCFTDIDRGDLFS